MWPDRVSNPGPLTYESGALPIALRGPASRSISKKQIALNQRVSLAGTGENSISVNRSVLNYA